MTVSATHIQTKGQRTEKLRVTMTILPEQEVRCPRSGSGGPSTRWAFVAVPVVVIALLGGYVLMHGGAAGKPTPVSPGSSAAAVSLAGLSGAQVLARVRSAALAAGSVQVLITQTSGARTLRMMDQDATDRGTQTITLGAGNASVIVVPGATFLRANHLALTTYFGFTAAMANRIGSQWLRLVPGNPGYTTVTEGVTLADTLKQIAMTGPFTVLTTTRHGQRVYGVRGLVAGPTKPAKVTATLWVSATGAPLPIEFVASSPGQGTMTATFSQWGQPVAAEPPASALTLVYQH